MSKRTVAWGAAFALVVMVVGLVSFGCGREEEAVATPEAAEAEAVVEEAAAEAAAVVEEAAAEAAAVVEEAAAAEGAAAAD